MSVVFKHAVALYDLLCQSAKEDEDTELLTFRGSITEVWRSLGVSQAYYSQVRRFLLESECISIVQQGARNTDSIIVLHRQPQADEWEVAQSDLTERVTIATLHQEVRNLKRLLGGIHLPDLVIDLDKRIRELER